MKHFEKKYRVVKPMTIQTWTDDEKTLSLSDSLNHYRAERPDEWQMDRFIAQAESYEQEIEEAFEMLNAIHSAHVLWLPREVKGEEAEGEARALHTLFDRLDELLSPYKGEILKAIEEE